MIYKLHAVLLIFCMLVVIGMLAFDTPMAEAQVPKLILGLSSIDNIYAVPGSKVQVDLTIEQGSYVNGDNVTSVQFMIEYNSSVVYIETLASDVVVHAETFGIATDWIIGASEPSVGTLKIAGARSAEGPTLKEPSAWPAVFATITFTVKTYRQADYTDLVFKTGSTETYFGTLDFKKFTIFQAINGKISFKPTGSTEIRLSLPSMTVKPTPGLEVPVGLKVEGGYINEDLIDGVVVTVAYNSAVVDIINKDVTAHLDRFGITGGWSVITNIKTDIPVPLEHPELNKQLEVQMFNTDNSQYPALSAVYPEDLLTIKVTVQSDDPKLSTRLLFIDTLHSYFQKRDTDVSLGKLLIGPLAEGPDDIHGDIALPVELSALGAISHLNNGTKIFWEATSQQGNLGWNIYRSETKDGKFVKVNGELIKGAGTTSNSMKYSFIDKDAEKGKVYYYYLEDISFNGEKHHTDLIKSIPNNKITSWGDIKHSALR